MKVIKIVKITYYTITVNFDCEVCGSNIYQKYEQGSGIDKEDDMSEKIICESCETGYKIIGKMRLIKLKESKKI